MVKPFGVRVQAAAATAAIIMLGVLIQICPPARYTFYPWCPVHALSGLQCPGCGGMRAVAALLAGGWGEAARQNALIVVLAPFALVFAAMQAYSAVRWNRWHNLRVSPLAITGLLAMAGLFAVVRNIGPLFR
jgi:hypothetical protein